MEFKTIKFSVATAKLISKGIIQGLIKTKSGKSVRILAWDYANGIFPIVAAIKDGEAEQLACFSEYGIKLGSTPEETFDDLELEVPKGYEDYSRFSPKKYQPCMVFAKNEFLKEYTWTIAVCAKEDMKYPKFFSTYPKYYKPLELEYEDFLPINDTTIKLYGTSKYYEQLFV